MGAEGRSARSVGEEKHRAYWRGPTWGDPCSCQNLPARCSVIFVATLQVSGTWGGGCVISVGNPSPAARQDDRALLAFPKLIHSWEPILAPTAFLDFLMECSVAQAGDKTEPYGSQDPRLSREGTAIGVPSPYPATLQMPVGSLAGLCGDPAGPPTCRQTQLSSAC